MKRARGRQSDVRAPLSTTGRWLLLWLGVFGVSGAAYGQETPSTGNERPRERESVAPINPTGQDFVLTLPVRHNTRLIGGLDTLISADSAISVSMAELLDLLRPRARAELLAQIEALPHDGRISASDLATGAGVIITFDPQAVELNLVLPSSAMAPIAIDLIGAGGQAISAETPPPEPFSIALNYRATLDFVQESSFRESGLNAPITDFDLLGRIGPAAYESEFFYDERIADSVVRVGSRAIFDQPASFRRWTVGDLFVESTGFQSVPDIAGMSVSRLSYEFPNADLAQIRGRQTFSIDRPSRVSILINGRPETELQLQPGFYDLRNFPFVTGANDVEVVIEDATGERRVLQFDFFLEGTLLAPGESEYHVAAGIESELNNDGRDYLSDEPLFTGFYRYGVGDRLTVGGNLQASDNARVVGGEATLAPGVGLLSVSFAGSDIDEIGSGFAARADYRWTFRSEKGLSRSLSALIEVRSELFGSIGTTAAPSNPQDYTLALRYTHGITEDVSGAVGFLYSHPREDEDAYIASASANLSWSATDRTRFSIGVGYDRNSTGEDEVSGSIFISHSFGQRHYANAGYDSRDERYSLNYTYLGRGGIGSYDGNVGVTRLPTGSNATGAVNYVAARARVGLSQSISTDAEDQVVESATSGRVAGAVAFAGGRVAIGHSLGDSFVILSPHESLQGAAIEVGDARNQLVTAKSGALGPALVSVSSYTPNVIAYNVPDAPLGYDLGLASATVELPLHGANAISVGSINNLTVVGILVDYTGAPVRLQAGRARNLDDPEGAEVEIFTNRSGRFGGSGLAPGRWQITTVTGEPLRYEVTIAPAGDTLIADVGVLQPGDFP